jgi:hypothetical protein
MATRKSTTQPNRPASAPADVQSLDARISVLESKLDQLIAALAAQARAARGGGTPSSGPTLADIVRQTRNVRPPPPGETAASASRGASFGSFLFNATLFVQDGKAFVRFDGDASEVAIEAVLAAGGRIQLDLTAESIGGASPGVQQSPGSELATLSTLFDFLAANASLVRGVGVGAICTEPGCEPD